MRQATGFLITILCFPLIWILYSFIHTEILTAANFNENLEQSIQLANPTFTSPLILLDKDEAIFSEDYIEWREPLPTRVRPLIYTRTIRYKVKISNFMTILDLTLVQSFVQCLPTLHPIQMRKVPAQLPNSL